MKDATSSLKIFGPTGLGLVDVEYMTMHEFSELLKDTTLPLPDEVVIVGLNTTLPQYAPPPPPPPPLPPLPLPPPPAPETEARAVSSASSQGDLASVVPDLGKRNKLSALKVLSRAMRNRRVETQSQGASNGGSLPPIIEAEPAPIGPSPEELKARAAAEQKVRGKDGESETDGPRE